MKTARQFVLLGVAVAMLSGCVIKVDTDDWEGDNWRHRQDRNERTISRLELGRDVNSVKDELGKPDFTESFIRNGDEYIVLFYRTRRMDGDGRTTRDETTPLVFVGGELVGWGDSAIENATRQ